VKRIILDENLPVPLRLLLAEFDVFTVQFQGWSGIQNGELIARIEGQFEVFITGDKNLRYQQNISGRRIAIIELPYTRLAQIEPLLDPIRLAVQSAGEGDYLQIAG
jgi:hypothetical protein